MKRKQNLTQVGGQHVYTLRSTYIPIKAVSYEEYFRQIFGGLGVLPVFWSSQERLTRNIFRKCFSPKSYSGNISQKSAPRQIFRAQIFLGQQNFEFFPTNIWGCGGHKQPCRLTGFEPLDKPTTAGYVALPQVNYTGIGCI